MAEIQSKIYIPQLNRVIPVQLDKLTQILPNFIVGEIANNKAKETVKLVIGDDRAWRLLQLMQLTRYRFGKMNVTSVYRTESYNASLPNADRRSCHLKCWAFDWYIPKQTDAQRKNVAAWWKSLCEAYGEIGAINFYTNGYHCEIGSDIQYGAAAFSIRDYRGKQGDW